APGPLRLFGVGLGDQGGWMLPFSFFGLLAAAALLLFERRRPDTQRAAGAGNEGDPRANGQGPSARDPRVAGILVFGGWFLVEAGVLSLSRGIVHPYYVSALAPGVAAMAGIGAGAFVALARRQPRIWPLILAPCAVAGTVAAQLVLLHREHYL